MMKKSNSEEKIAPSDETIIQEDKLLDGIQDPAYIVSRVMYCEGPRGAIRRGVPVAVFKLPSEARAYIVTEVTKWANEDGRGTSPKFSITPIENCIK